MPQEAGHEICVIPSEALYPDHWTDFQRGNHFAETDGIYLFIFLGLTQMSQFSFSCDQYSQVCSLYDTIYVISII